MISQPKIRCQACHRLFSIRGIAKVAKGGQEATFYARCGCGCRLLTFFQGRLSLVTRCDYIPQDASMETGDDPEKGYYQDYTPA